MIKHAIEAMSLWLKTFESNTKYAPGSPFIELERLPGIVLEGPTISENRRQDYSQRPEFERQGSVYEKRKGPRHYDMEFTVTVLSKKQQDLMRYIVDLTSHVAETGDLEFPAAAPEYSCRMYFASDFAASGGKSLSAVCEARAKLRVESVPLLPRSVETVPVIEKIRIEAEVEEGGKDVWVEDSRPSL